jgi:transcriptional regulator with XRE-family HTH domain
MAISKKQALTPVDLRKRLGMTQEQAAKAIGIRPATLSSWETGRIPRMSPSFIKKMMEIYNCSLDDLIEAFEDGVTASSLDTHNKEEQA